MTQNLTYVFQGKECYESIWCGRLSSWCSRHSGTSSSKKGGKSCRRARRLFLCFPCVLLALRQWEDWDVVYSVTLPWTYQLTSKCLHMLVAQFSTCSILWFHYEIYQCHLTARHSLHFWISTFSCSEWN